MKLADRIKAVRKSKKLSQAAFGEKLGVSRDVINNAENGRAIPSELFVRHLCDIYNVNEEWLRNNVGNMYRENENTSVDKLANEFSLDEVGQAILRSYLKLNDSQKVVIGNYIKSIATEYERAKEEKAQEKNNVDKLDPDIKKELDNYRQELEIEKSIQTSSALQNTGEKTG